MHSNLGCSVCQGSLHPLPSSKNEAMVIHEYMNKRDGILV
jgi:hypothetical protein